MDPVWLAIPVLVAATAAGAHIVVPYAVAKLHKRHLARLTRARRAVVLTYDDGPSHELTDKVLGLLREEGVRATFFSIGSRAEEASEVLDRVAADGHEIGCHSHAHLHAWKVRPRRAVLDIERGFSSLERWVKPDGAFRPPYGKVNAFTLLSLLRRRAVLSWWTHTGGDTLSPLPSVDAVVDSVITSGGGVVLLHDFDRSDADDARRCSQFVLDTTRRLIGAARAEGLEICTLGELLEVPAG